MFLVGLTGSIGTGKTTISDYLRKCNIPVLDSDQIAREVVEPGTSCWHKIRKEFGPESINEETGKIDRAKISEIIFNDPQKRLVLNRITHPAIRKKMIQRILWNYLTFQPFVVLDVPLFFEVGVYRKFCAYTMVVSSTQQQQLERLKLRNGYSDEEAAKRINSQISIDDKCRMADFVIDNTADRERAIQQTNDILARLSFPLSFWIFRFVLILFYVSLSFTIFWIFFS